MARGTHGHGAPSPRYAFTVAANIAVYGAAWLLLHLQASHSGHPEDVALGDQLGVQDVPVFRVSWARSATPAPPGPEGHR